MSNLTTIATLPAFAEAYEELAPGLRRYALARTRDEALAEDIVQDAFLRLADEERAGRTPDSRRAWLYRVALNIIISRSRRADVARRRTPPVTLDDLTTASPEDVVLASERDDAVRATLRAASPVARRSLVLAAEGYSGREIARAIGRTEGATRTLMSRARGDMRRELARTYYDVA
jgi:RNA polymerase sigma-70 factor (ECF subfamily)